MSESHSSATSQQPPVAEVARHASRPIIRRWILATLGIVSVGIGAVGVFVPGLPTTIFLIFASWCFIRSFPALERRLLRNKFFARYLPFMDGTLPLSMRHRITAICTMWLFAGTSALIFFVTRGPTSWPGYVILAAACVGTFAILRWRRNMNRQEFNAEAQRTRRKAGETEKMQQTSEDEEYEKEYDDD